MSWTYYFIIAGMFGIHFPVAWAYVNRSLAGLDPDVQRQIREGLRTRMLVLGLPWASGFL
jgi:hypothetical protein